MNCLSLDHTCAPAEVRRQYAWSGSVRAAIARELHGVVLVTCNRTELYFRCSRKDAEAAIGRAAEGFPSSARFYRACAAEEHLFSLAAGLCSMLAGEDEILGQLRRAYEEAQTLHVTRGLDALFQAAIACGKRVRAETKISSIACSVATLAASEVADFLGDGGRVLLIGATGSIGGSVMKNLLSHGGMELLATERTHGLPAAARGEGVRSFAYEARYRLLSAADAVVCCTASPHVVLTREGVADAIKKCPRERLFVDLAMPPDVDPAVGELPGCRLVDIDGLAERARRNNERKREAVAAAEKLVAHCLAEYRAAEAARTFAHASGELPGELCLLRKRDPDGFAREVARRLEQ